MAKKAAKKSSTSKKSTKKSTSKSATKTAAKAEPMPEGCAWCKNELADEHRVLSHLMYILFLFSVGFAVVFTLFLLLENVDPDFYGQKAIVLLLWAFLFKTFGHRIHVPHH